jgi:pyruvate dehydrogenase E2 component (dihydrolipoamide acetyltransferase)
MPADVIMPALGMAQETGKVLRWLKGDGDEVAKGEPIVEIETDKVTVEVESPAAGTLGAVQAAEGEDVPVGETIALVFAAGEERVAAAPKEQATAAVAEASPLAATTVAAAAETSAAAEPSRRRLASPKARRIAAEQGIDLATLAGSGPNGAVVAADVLAAPASAPAPVNGQPLTVGSVWRAMAEHTTRSWQTVPQFTLRRKVDASRLQSWREAARREPGAEGVSITDLLVRLVAEALRRHPRVNASWRDGTILPGPGINVGIAVASEDGLVVPVVHGADRLTLAGIAARRREIVEAARAGRLRPDDVAGGTFTISNLGMFGVDGFDAIVNAPQAAILAVGRIVEEIVPVGGLPAVRPTLELSVSFDHRTVDGARGAEFLQALAELVEEPAALVR